LFYFIIYVNLYVIFDKTTLLYQAVIPYFLIC